MLSVKIKLAVLSHHNWCETGSQHRWHSVNVSRGDATSDTSKWETRDRFEQMTVCIFVDINFDKSDEVIQMKYALNCRDFVDTYTHTLYFMQKAIFSVTVYCFIYLSHFFILAKQWLAIHFQSELAVMVTMARNSTSMAQQRLHDVLLNFPWIKTTATTTSTQPFKNCWQRRENVGVPQNIIRVRTKSFGTSSSHYALAMTINNFVSNEYFT